MLIFLRHYCVEFEWAWLNKVMESEWDMVWHFNYFTRWVPFQELVNVRIYIKWFFFFFPLDFELRSSRLFLIGTVVLMLANTCFCSVFTEQNITVWRFDCISRLSASHTQLRIKFIYDKRQLNISTEKDSSILFVTFCPFAVETFTPLPSASVLTAKGRRSFIFLKTSYSSYGTH